LELLADLYHELGHIYRWQYGIPNTKRRFFRAGRQAGFSQKEIRNFKDYERPTGFASSYATTSSDEDWAETFSCYLLNKERTSGTIYYGGEKIKLANDRALQRKLKVIQKILCA
jgi:hypothetical protein